jgi:phage terminase large subunit-like protein
MVDNINHNESLGIYKGLTSYCPHPKQFIFHLLQNKIKAFIGGERSGKSTATSYEAVWTALGSHPFWKDAPQPPVKIRIVGPDTATVIDRVNLPTILKIVPKDCAHFWKERNVLEFFNGSEIYFQSNEQEVEKFGGMSLHMVIEDEEPRKDIHNENLMRLIDTGGRLLMSYTPMNGITWSYNDIFLNDERDIDGNLLVGKVFCKTRENPYISEKEIDIIKKIYKDQEEIEAHLEGSYFSSSGLILKEFDRSKHVVEPRDPSTYGMIIVGIDHHQRAKEAIIFCSVDHNDNVHVFDEIYEEGLISDTAARIGKVLDGRKPAYTIIDVNAATPNSIVGWSDQKEYARYGIHTLLAKKGHGSVNEGIGVLRQYFRDDKITISRKCGNLINQLSSYIWDDWASRVRARKNVKEVPMKRDDHLIDCYSEDTEILTDNGWKLFSEINEKDLVATLNPSTWYLEYQKPSDYIEHKYCGDMLLYDGGTSNFFVTPNHKFYSARQMDFKVKKLIDPLHFKLGLSYQFGVEFPCKKDAYWDGNHQEFFILPEVLLDGNTRKPSILRQPIKIPMNDWLEFFGLFLSEGFTSINGSRYRVGISQFENNVRFDEVKRIINKLPFMFTYESTSHRFHTNNKQLWSYLKQFGKSRDRFIPKDIKSLSSDNLLHLWNGLMLGDGTFKDSSIYSNDKYDSISELLINDIQEISLKLGKYGNILKFKLPGSMVSPTNNKIYKQADSVYRINFSKRSGFVTIKSDNIDWVEYSGYVRCVSVPNHIVYVRRGGKPMWCGNSLRYLVHSRPKYRAVDSIRLPQRKVISKVTAY